MKRACLSMIALLAMTACGENADVWTLYRDSQLDPAMRIHWATFDADDAPGFNRSNCQAAADLINRQREVTVRYWCEQGRYRK